MAVPRRAVYDPETKANVLAILASNAGNVKATLRELASANVHVPRSTVRDWKRRPEKAAPEELRAQAIEQLGAAIELGVAKYAVILLDDEYIATLAASKPEQIGTQFGILFDKLVAVRGKPKDVIGGEEWKKLLEDLRRSAAERQKKPA